MGKNSVQENENGSLSVDSQATTGSDSSQVVNTILSMNMNELLKLAEGVGESGEYEAFGDAGEGNLEEFRKLQEKSYKLFKQQRMPLIGGGGHNNPGMGIGIAMPQLVGMPSSGSQYMT